MLRFKIFRFLKILSQQKDKLNAENLSKYIDNSNLIKEILLQNDFKYLWRQATKSQILNETYKLKRIKINKIKDHCTILLKINHSLTLMDSNSTKNSKEILELYLQLSKSPKWKINNIVNKELQPILYEKLVNNKAPSYNLFDNSSYWKAKINNLDNILSSFNELKNNNYRNTSKNFSINYNVNKAVEYARNYALKPNKLYKDFSDKGGDCTNFVSQCLFAGNLPLSNSWQPYTGTWIRVTELYYYLLRKSYGHESDNKFDFQKGSIIQFFSNTKGYYAHSGIITEVLSNGDCLYCCHSYNKLDYPLSEIYPILYDKFRIIHITY
ncbi:MAG: amidase domain-containing protein [Clostridiaceae bacterium]|nr:amidase domain-containing protein [Clostridiaceae bacterium]